MDDAGICVRVLNELLADWGRGPVSLEDYRAEFGFPVKDYYRRLGFPLEQKEFETVSQRFIKRYYELFEEARLHLGVADLIEELGESGVTHSVLSASKQEHLEHAVNALRITHHFEALIGISNIFAHGKLEEGRRWVAEMPWRKEEVLLIGDTLHDHEVAGALGIPCILLAHGHYSPDRLRESGAEVCENLDELRALLARRRAEG